MIKSFRKDRRHIRWNCERSPEGDDRMRYHFVFVDDRDRELMRDRVLEQLRSCGFIEKVRESQEGKVVGTKFRYLFESYDSNIAPGRINWQQVRDTPIKRDGKLVERKRGSVEDYVYDLYDRRR